MSLPPELTLMILDLAEYWPKRLSRRPKHYSTRPRYAFAVERDWSLDTSGAQAYLITEEIPTGKQWDKVKLKDVAFYCTICDHGWTVDAGLVGTSLCCPFCMIVQMITLLHHRDL
jgi:hypothetical protein